MASIGRKFWQATLVCVAVVGCGGVEEPVDPPAAPGQEQVLPAEPAAAGELEQAATVLPPPAGYFQMINRNSGLCAAVTGASTTRGTRLWLEPCSATATHQQWRAEAMGDGTYRLRPRHANLCVGISYSTAANGGQFVTWDCVAGAGDHKHRLEHQGSGFYRVIPSHSGRCMDVEYASTNPYSYLIQWDCHGSWNQFWTLKPVDTKACGVPVTESSGGDTPYSATVPLNKTSGTFKFTYETYTIKDRMVVKYQGNVLHDTGCRSTSAPVSVNLNFSGSQNYATVDVYPNCAGTTGTAWKFTVSCP